MSPADHDDDEAQVGVGVRFEKRWWIVERITQLPLGIFDRRFRSMLNGLWG